MKATLVHNTKELPRILLEMESMEETAAMAHQPDLLCIMEETGTHTLLKLAYEIKPTHKTERHFQGDPTEGMSDEDKINYLHGEYGQLKLKYVVLEGELAKARHEVHEACYAEEIAVARLAKLIRACNQRKVGEQWPAIESVIKSFGKVDDT